MASYAGLVDISQNFTAFVRHGLDMEQGGDPRITQKMDSNVLPSNTGESHAKFHTELVPGGQNKMSST
ncbi:hypothetical protein PACG_00207, partial [Pseudomonas aeruginosa C3719]